MGVAVATSAGRMPKRPWSWRDVVVCLFAAGIVAYAIAVVLAAKS